jgi:hypothetical protein
MGSDVIDDDGRLDSAGVESEGIEAERMIGEEAQTLSLPLATVAS